MKTTARRVDVTKEHVPDEALTEAIRGFRETIENSMDIVLGRSKVMLDARFSEIRTKETNVSNFLAELMTRATGANIAILNAGTIRADRFVEPGFEWEALATSMSVRGRRVEGFLPPLVPPRQGTLHSYAPSRRNPLVEGKIPARNNEDGAGVGGKGVAGEASFEAAQ